MLSTKLVCISIKHDIYYLAQLALDFLSPILIHETDSEKVLYCFPKAHYADIKVGFSIPQRKIRFQLFRLAFPDTEGAVEYSSMQFTALFSVPDGYEIIGTYIGEKWKGVELKLVELDECEEVQEFAMQ